MKRKEPSMFLCRVLVSLIGALMIGFLGFGVRAFATAEATQFIFFAASIISVAILVLYITLRRPTRDPMAHAPFREPPFVKRSPFPRLYTIGGNPFTLDHPPERASRASLAVVKTAGDSLIVSAPASPALIGLEFPVYEAKRYEERVKAGGILLSVLAGDSAWRNP